MFIASDSMQLFLLFLQVFLWKRQGKDTAEKQFAGAGVSFHGYLLFKNDPSAIMLLLRRMETFIVY